MLSLDLPLKIKTLRTDRSIRKTLCLLSLSLMVLLHQIPHRRLLLQFLWSRSDRATILARFKRSIGAVKKRFADFRRSRPALLREKQLTHSQSQEFSAGFGSLALLIPSLTQFVYVVTLPKTLCRMKAVYGRSPPSLYLG